MLMDALKAMVKGSAGSKEELARALDVDLSMVDQLLGDLVQRGYLKEQEQGGCHDDCGGCGGDCGCHEGEKEKPQHGDRLLVLTNKGLEAVEKQLN